MARLEQVRRMLGLRSDIYSNHIDAINNDINIIIVDSCNVFQIYVSFGTNFDKGPIEKEFDSIYDLIDFCISLQPYNNE